MAVDALVAGPAGAGRAGGHAVAHLEALDARAQLMDGAHVLVPGDEAGREHAFVVDVKIGAADAAQLDLDHGLAGAGLRNGPVDQGEGVLVFIQCCLHSRPPSSGACLCGGQARFSRPRVASPGELYRAGEDGSMELGQRARRPPHCPSPSSSAHRSKASASPCSTAANRALVAATWAESLAA